MVLEKELICEVTSGFFNDGLNCNEVRN